MHNKRNHTDKISATLQFTAELGVRPQTSPGSVLLSPMNAPMSSHAITHSPSRHGRTMRRVGNAAVLVCACFVLLGAFYFGIASYGGYIWHK